jgi:hypothetical protein
VAGGVSIWLRAAIEFHLLLLGFWLNFEEAGQSDREITPVEKAPAGISWPVVRIDKG